VARGSVFAGEAVAHQLRSVTFVESVRNAFVHGIDVALLVSAGIAAAGIVLTLAFLPGKASRRRAEQVEREQSVAAVR
jgi:hypothetical protein